MMDVATILNVQQVEIDMEAQTQEEVIRKLSEKINEKQVLTNKDAYIGSVLERESQSTTGVGGGIAIPHGKSKGVLEAAIAVGKLKTPVEWKSLDDQPVSVVIMFAIPEKDKKDTHLKLLSQISMKLMDDDVVEKLKKETDKQKIVNILS